MAVSALTAVPPISVTSLLLIPALGVFILWFGFNPGSTLSGLNPDISKIAMNTNLAAAAGALLAMFVSWGVYGRADVGMTLNGALAGLVGITAGCASVTPVGSILIGAASGVAVVTASIAL